jgi:2-succinyl-6-hydroxy-2,4-cyclohexadiene-1-carboxylate synthase
MTTDIPDRLPRARLHAVHRAAAVEPATRLVLVHGFTQTGACWAPVLDGLGPRSAATVVDAPGHGGSAQVRADLWAGADLLVATGGRAVYVGYSMGGRLALHAALARPELVEGLVLVGATAGIDDPSARARRRAQDERRAAHLEDVGVERFVDEWLAGPLFAGLSAAVDCRAARRTNSVEGLASSLRLAGTGAQDDLWPRVHELAMPVLVVAGAHDRKFTALGRRLAATIGPSATFATVAGAGHSAHLEQPAAFVALLEGWLDDQAENHSPTASRPP